MTNPAVIIVTGVVIAVAAVIAIFASNEPQKMRHGRGGSGYGTSYRPPSPPQSPIRRRRRSRERMSATCRNCNGSQFITVYPCNHKCLCKHCFETHLENNDTCPACGGRISRCSPPISSYGSCKNCKSFTKLFKFLPCNHSLSLCISCFERENKSHSVCPECDQHIQVSEPSWPTSGVCSGCNIFTRLAKFIPCGHAAFCKKDAELYLDPSDRECSECGQKVTKVV